MLQFMQVSPTPAPPADMTSLFTDLSGGFTVILTAVSNACATIVSNPFLLFTCVFLFAGGVIGIIGRLLSRG